MHNFIFCKSLQPFSENVRLFAKSKEEARFPANIYFVNLASTATWSKDRTAWSPWQPIRSHSSNKSAFLSTLEREKNNIFSASEAMHVWYDEQDQYDSWC